MIPSVSNFSSKINFQSKNNPIESYSVQTPLGNLDISEVSASQVVETGEIFNIAKFFLDNFLTNTIDKAFQEYTLPENKKEYELLVDRYADIYYKFCNEDDGNTTVLLAKDEKGDIQAGLLATTYKEVEELADNRTLLIDSVAISPEYRKSNLTKEMHNKIMESSRNDFDDQLIMADNLIIPFCEKKGFRHFDYSNPAIMEILNKIVKKRNDSLEFMTPMFMPLKKEGKNVQERILDRLG